MKRSGRDDPFFFQQRKRSANVKSGNSVAVAVRRVDRRRVRDRVDGGDKEQQTEQPDGVFAFQRVLEQEKAIPLASIPFHDNNDITFGTKM